MKISLSQRFAGCALAALLSWAVLVDAQDSPGATEQGSRSPIAESIDVGETPSDDDEVERQAKTARLPESGPNLL